MPALLQRCLLRRLVVESSSDHPTRVLTARRASLRRQHSGDLRQGPRSGGDLVEPLVGPAPAHRAILDRNRVRTASPYVETEPASPYRGDAPLARDHDPGMASIAFEWWEEGITPIVFGNGGDVGCIRDRAFVRTVNSTRGIRSAINSSGNSTHSGWVSLGSRHAGGRSRTIV